MFTAQASMKAMVSLGNKAMGRGRHSKDGNGCGEISDRAWVDFRLLGLEVEDWSSWWERSRREWWLDGRRQ